ncbi:unnamed protein product [Clonostachys chloroleuca]|uniref:Uncharacterized protein n=1 Tax=Clonostachys chloroleuca TaxID=1926264 RepID=A0AA35VQ37_9HYPO|nr:unnamed protein product [Clonostachys chloroleuca]
MKDKRRLYISIRKETIEEKYSLSNSYRWMILICDKNEDECPVPGIRFTTTLGNAVVWEHVTKRDAFIARFMIGKIRDEDPVRNAITEVQTPIDVDYTSQNWIQAVLDNLKSLRGDKMALPTNTKLDWEDLTAKIHQYLQNKIQIGVLQMVKDKGKEEYEFWEEHHWPEGKPRLTMNLLEGKEIHDGK